MNTFSQTLQILSAEKREWKKNGNSGSMIICQCVLLDQDAGLKVGELTMPRDAEAPVPGYYNAVFKFGFHYRDKKIGCILEKLIPVSSAARPVSPVAQPVQPAKI
jgi:hypothetical protein